ncbi:MAG: hypothetical protein HC852_05225 [Acaryochloridaceae cyanobacterium RU_4_10]|nr:hypothetical protein [Acaryochloridaceae cyanobacterium RU_4_10]
MNSTLKNHPIWDNLDRTFKQLDPNKIAIQHLQDCKDQINGYWDEDEFYEVISFTQKPCPELISSSLGLSPASVGNTHWLQLKFALTVNSSDGLEQTAHKEKNMLGELLLILDENLGVVDENWLIDLHSPYVLTRS